MKLRPSFEIVKYLEYITEYYHRVFFMGHCFLINKIEQELTEVDLNYFCKSYFYGLDREMKAKVSNEGL